MIFCQFLCIFEPEKKKQAKQIINFIASRLKKKATNYRVRPGQSLRSAISCQRKWLMFTDIGQYLTGQPGR